MMKKIFSLIPGYRTKKTWKIIIASLYYAFSLLMLVAGIGVFLAFISMPFFVFGIIDTIRYKAPKRLLISAVSIAVIILGISISPSSQIDSAPTPSPSPTATALPSATPEPTPTPTPEPTPEPTAAPTAPPTAAPTAPPTAAPTPAPTAVQSASTKTGTSPSSGTANTNTGSASESSGTTVYIGDTGTKYHRASCSTLKGGGHAISLDAALAQGRQACKRCKP